MTTEQYNYGLAALMYITTCWMFAAVRWFHTCRAPRNAAPISGLTGSCSAYSTVVPRCCCRT